MEIKLNITEEKFNEVLQKELEAFSKEELKNIIHECIVKKLMDDELISNLLTYENKGYYGNSYREPSAIMKMAAEQIDLSSAYKEIQDKMISYMKENYADMMVKIMSNIMLTGITDSHDFRQAIQYAVQDELCRRANS